MVGQIELLDRLIYGVFDHIGPDTLDQGIEFKRLFYRQLREDRIILWAIANELSGLLKISLDIEARDLDLARSRFDLASQALKSCRLTSTIDTK